MKLTDFLNKLKPTGEKGFEGLVAKLLSELTGNRFRLARSGYQAGRDGGSREYGVDVIFFEAKRYRDTILKARELIGEIIQAVQASPDLDIWILVTTREIDHVLYEQLDRTCRDQLVEFVALDVSTERDNLSILCAAFPQIVLSHLQSDLDLQAQRYLHQILENIANTNGLSDRLDTLRSTLLAPTAGYANWRRQQNSWFCEQLTNEISSRTAFKQIINVSDGAANFVPRSEVWSKYDQWWNNWSENGMPILSVLGEEGDGKSWSVAAWLSKQVSDNDDFPAIIFVPSSEAEAKQPLELLLSVKSPQRDIRDPSVLERKLEKWLHTQGCVPKFLFVLDGLNEYHTRSHWLGILDNLSTPDLQSQIAVIVTCRIKFWSSLDPQHLNVDTYQVPPYTDQELDIALSISRHDLQRVDVTQSLLPLIRKPRYFDLMMKHYATMAESGDVTVTRLIYEDWRDKAHRKRSLSDLSHEDFQYLIRELASKHIDESKPVRIREIEAFLPYRVDAQAILNELESCQLIIQQKVDPDYLAYGLGLLLVDEMMNAEKENKDLEETLAEWLEPHSDMDIKAEICSFAALHAISSSITSRPIQVLLLEAWIVNRNSETETAGDFKAYMPIDPETYFDLAERVWRLQIDNHWLQSLLMTAILYWQDNDNVRSKLTLTFERWLGFVNLYGFLGQRRDDEPDAVPNQIRNRVGIELNCGEEFTYQGYKFTVICDDGLLRLGNFALAVISYLPHQQFEMALVKGIIAEVIMGYAEKFKQFAWIFQTANQSLLPHFRPHIERLFSTDNRVTISSAARILRLEGSAEAYQLNQSNVPANFYDKSWLDEQQEGNPCHPFLSWSKDLSKHCLQQEDVTAWTKCGKVKDFVVDPAYLLPPQYVNQLRIEFKELSDKPLDAIYGNKEGATQRQQYETSFCRTIPSHLTEHLRSITDNLSSRSTEAIWLATVSLDKIQLLLTPDDYAAIIAAWERTKPEQPSSSERNGIIEQVLFKYVLVFSTPQEQLVRSLRRHISRVDLVMHAEFYKSPIDVSMCDELLKQATEIETIQRIFHFLLTSIEQISITFIEEKLLDFLTYEDSILRSLVMEIIYQNGNEQLLARWNSTNWRWGPDISWRENYWGSLLITAYASHIPHQDIFVRCHPAYWGIAVEKFEADRTVTELYVNALNNLLCHLTGDEVSLPPDFPTIDLHLSGGEHDVPAVKHWSLSDHNYPQTETIYANIHSTWGGESNAFDYNTFKKAFDEQNRPREQNVLDIVNKVSEDQLGSGNILFLEWFDIHSLDLVVTHDFPMLDKWIEQISDTGQTDWNLLRRAYTFYYSLCEVLLKRRPDKGAELYRRLQSASYLTFVDSETKIEQLDCALFQTNVSELQELQQDRLDSCKSDLELLRLCVAAQNGENTEGWLLKQAIEKSQNASPRHFSQGVTILGMLVQDESVCFLEELHQKTPPTWRQSVVTASIERWYKNQYAQHWFREFWNIKDQDKAWAAFRLFLDCVDSRFWLWRDSIIEQSNQLPKFEKRLLFLRFSKDEIRNRIRKNEEDRFKKTLFTAKVQTNQLWPWIDEA